MHSRILSLFVASCLLLLMSLTGCGSSEVDEEPIELSPDDPAAAAQLQNMQRMGQRLEQIQQQQQQLQQQNQPSEP